MSSQIYWVGGGKGGVGKSMVSMALLDYLVARGVSTMLIESDTSNPDVCKTYKDTLPCELLDLDKVDGWIQLVNACDAHRDRVVVVNTPARSNAGVASFGGTLITSLGDLDRSLTTLWAINRQRDSLELLKAFMDVMTESRVFVLRNLYFGDETKFELYAESQTRPRIEARGGRSLNFPDLADRVADDLSKERVTIASALETLPLGNRAELRRWKGVVAKMMAAVVDG
jgi:hypothetical protein